jgi:hypothetical protein
MAALTGTRVLIARDFHAAPDHAAREIFNAALVRGGLADVGREAARWGVTHIVVTPEFLASQGVALSDLDARRDLRRVHFTGHVGGDYVAVYALAAPTS